MRPLVWGLAFALLSASSLVMAVYAPQTEQLKAVFAVGSGFFLIAALSRLSQFWEEQRVAALAFTLLSKSLPGFRVVARDVSIDFALREPDFEDVEREGKGDWLWLDYVVEFQLHNRSPDDETFAIPFLPSPDLGRGKGFAVRLERVQMGDRVLSPSEIEASRQGDRDDSSYVLMGKLRAGEYMAFHMQGRAKRERSDSEIWSFPFAIEEMVRFRLSAPKAFRYDFQSLAPRAVKMVAESPTFRMATMEGPLPPRNSVVAWWRSPESSGQMA